MLKIQTMIKIVWFSNMSKLVQIQYELLRFIRFSNMSEHVQTCLNLFRFNMIQIVTIHAILKHVWTCWNMSKLVQIQYDMNCYNSYDSQTCLNLFRINMIRIDMILKHVKTWNQNMTKYSKIWANGRWNVWWQSYSLDRCEQVERSKTLRNIECLCFDENCPKHAHDCHWRQNLIHDCESPTCIVICTPSRSGAIWISWKYLHCFKLAILFSTSKNQNRAVMEEGKKINDSQLKWNEGCGRTP